jgi:serine/threonine protein kinase/tetratricopeptide (TPR) repeat protein
MASERLDEKAIFNVARKIASPDGRADYLRQVCGSDGELRERVEQLLGAFEEQTSFLESPPAGQLGLSPEQPVAEAAGTVLGPYKLLQQIGEGGMGTVWMAQQTEPVKRLVAVKLIKAGMESRQVIARFEAERQALALMDHPNIARVLDAGTTGAGRPYFVMDLVKGTPITRYCDEHHLTPRQRLELFVPVCQAIQHAHQKGIIHRDLKPSNVLIALYDGKPVPKVIDFGVAKAAGQTLTEKTLVTGFGAIVGTLEYMSPEQAEVNQLDIDTRSDIYSLGVLLYELLTGGPPFSRGELEKAGMLEMLRVIREQEPSKPSTRLSTAEGLPTLAANRGTEPAKLTKLLRGELDWIVMKALEKDRNRRYETANGFAMDVQRYLNDEQVQACPPSATYRFRKFARRNKGPVLAAGLVLVVLVGGITGTTCGMLRAIKAEADAGRETAAKTRALATATANETKAKAAQKAAQENLKEAVAAVDQMLMRVGQDRLLYVPQMETLRQELIQDAVDFYKRFLDKNSDDPLILRETAMANRRLAALYRELGQYAESEAAFRDAFALFARMEAQAPLEPSIRDDLVLAHIEFAYSLGGQRKRDEQEQNIRRAVEIAEGLLKEFPHAGFGDRLANAIGHLAQFSSPGEEERLRRRALTLAKQPWQLGHTLGGLGELVGGQGRYAEAEQLAREAVKAWEQTAALYPEANWSKNLHGTSLVQLARWVAASGRLPEALEISSRAITILDKVAADYPRVYEYQSSQSRAHHRHAVILKMLNRTTEAEESYRRAVELFEKLAADFPALPEPRQTAFEHRLGLGRFLSETGQTDAALQIYGDAVDQVENLPTDLPGRLGHWQGLVRSHIGLGRMFTTAGKLQEAQTAFRDALAIRDRMEKEFADQAEFRPDLAASHLKTADSLRGARRVDDAIESFRMAISHAQKWVDSEPRTRDGRAVLADTYLQLATIFRWNKGQWLEAIAESEKAARKSLALHDELAAEFPETFEFAWRAAESVRLLATIEERRQQFPKSEDLWRQAIARYQNLQDWPAHLRTDHDAAHAEARIGQTESSLARTLERLGRSQEAGESYERSVSWLKRSPQNPDTARSFPWQRKECHLYFGLFLAENGRTAEAHQHFRQAIEVYDTASMRNELAWMLVTHPNPRVRNDSADLAVKWASEAADLAPNDGMIVNTLGAVLYRAGRWQEAVAALEKSMELRKGGDSFDWFFLAMAHWKLGEKDKACQWYDRAVQWMEEKRPASEELRRIRNESEELVKE